MQSAPSSLQQASKSSSPSRSTRQPQGFLLPLWRASWLAAAAVFSWAYLSAEHKMSTLFDGSQRTTAEALALAEESVSRFPIDPYLRAKRRYVRSMIASIPERERQKQRGGYSAVDPRTIHEQAQQEAQGRGSQQGGGASNGDGERGRP